ncbi:transcriptional repressor [Micromonospora sp. WMMA1363]|uniref:transcriptional repressor n=1 Tax=Micromonospora sp. WMMA1363 TaxID=3053985 RepID=UPI00259CE490|nr:transcriptional repressor [Micromonospora sp. WMMA1363]MDM4721217.1 transcriptional repressor [Micromonospora sp. WMMA1363]
MPVVGLTSTAPRRAVLALLAGRSRPLTAQEVHAGLTSTLRHIGLTTVYRAVHSLADAGCCTPSALTANAPAATVVRHHTSA